MCNVSQSKRENGEYMHNKKNEYYRIVLQGRQQVKMPTGLKTMTKTVSGNGWQGECQPFCALMN